MAVAVTALAILLTTASTAAGLWAARLWWRASRLPVPERVPPWAPGRSTGDPNVEALGEATATVEALRALSEGMREGSRLNARAARWTAASVAGLFVGSAMTWAAGWLSAMR